MSIAMRSDPMVSVGHSMERVLSFKPGKKCDNWVMLMEP